MTNIDKLKEKLTAQRLKNEAQGVLDIKNNKQVQKDFNDEMVSKTWKYQKKFGFETNPRKGHEFWNVEADAFKHAFGGAIMYFRYGNWGSTLAGIYHEGQTKNNPEGEWNMDSWNNDQGRKVAQEIIKEYGKDFYEKNPEKCENIMAAKIVSRMRNGELITHPSDKRKYRGPIETVYKKVTDKRDNSVTKNSTGQAAPVSKSIKSTSPTASFSKTNTPKTPSQKFSDEIRQKFKAKNLESNKRLNRILNFHNPNPNLENGHWVTMNGAHVFIEDK